MSGYVTVGVLLLVGVVLIAGAGALNALLSPSRPAASEGFRTYESGVDPVGEGWAQSQIRYFVYAFLYVVFAVEAVFLYPWATVYADPEFGAGALIEMAVFVGLLALVLLYVWRKRVLTWT
jgi:NADH-quinone oxidoreductase subunit A